MFILVSPTQFYSKLFLSFHKVSAQNLYVFVNIVMRTTCPVPWRDHSEEIWLMYQCDEENIKGDPQVRCNGWIKKLFQK